jgi:hypothetical protein
MESGAKQPRVSIEVPPQISHRLRRVAAKRELTIRPYVLQAIEQRLREDPGDDAEGIGGVTASADPVLAGLWDNRRDAEHEHRKRGAMAKGDLDAVDDGLRRSVAL